MVAKRIYSNKEISALLKRASELHRTKGPGMSGLSLEELEQIAGEVGISPEYLKEAAVELEEDQTWEGFQWLGAPTSIDLERIVDGEMTEAQWDAAVGDFRRVFGTDGKVGQVGRTWEWIRTGEEDNKIEHVTVSPVAGQTRIHVFSRMWVWALCLHLPFMGVSIAPIAIQYGVLELGALPETGIALSIAAAFHGAARLIYGSIVRKEDRKVRKLLNRLGELIATRDTALLEHETREAAPEAGHVEAASEGVSPALRREREVERR